MDRIKLGDVARDSITGFQGVVTGRYEYLYGCVRFSLQPQALHEGKPVEAAVFDEPQLWWISSPDAEQPARGPSPLAPGAPGGPRPNPPGRQEPTRR